MNKTFNNIAVKLLGQNRNTKNVWPKLIYTLDMIVTATFRLVHYFCLDTINIFASWAGARKTIRSVHAPMARRVRVARVHVRLTRMQLLLAFKMIATVTLANKTKPKINILYRFTVRYPKSCKQSTNFTEQEFV